MSNVTTPSSDDASSLELHAHLKDASLMPPPKTVLGRAISGDGSNKSLLAHSHSFSKDGVGVALTDTPVSTAPNSPQIQPRRQESGASTPAKLRATTLDIPGLTKSRVSPDGRIAQRDIGAKLVIVMVGLPARGKSYITKKTARYLNWLQHDTKIFNVGERRRVAAGAGHVIKDTSIDGRLRDSVRKMSITTGTPNGIVEQSGLLPLPALATKILVNGETPPQTADSNSQSTNGHNHNDYFNDPSAHDSEVEQNASPPSYDLTKVSTPDELPGVDPMEQSADFFDPANARAFQIREQVAMETLDELLDYILDQGGSVGILDATNSTLERRNLIMKRIRERAGPDLGVLFLESRCLDQNLLESNMLLKLSGPDYKDQDPVTALEDFKKRVALYEKSYVPLGEYEEKNNMAYIQMIDVGRKVVSHQIRGFLSAQTVYYLLNFNLSPRQIWITRHGESIDNVLGKIGGDSSLSTNGIRYAKALTRFIAHERQAWEQYQRAKQLATHFPPRPGDTTPPNPEYANQSGDGERNFCVWTSMLRRSIETAQYFNEDDYDLKQMRMLDELNAGMMEGMTYEEIKVKFKDEYELRKNDKLQYRYPGAGGEGYLDIINRLRAVIVEVERMTDHVLLVGHRSVARVLLAYFRGLKREDVADLDVPLGVLYMLEPKPYGVDFKAYRYNSRTDWFDYDPKYEMRKATSHYS